MRTIDFDDHVARELARASLIPQRRTLRWATLGLGLLAGVALLVAAIGDFPFWPGLLLVALALISGLGWGYFWRCYQNGRRRRGQLQAGLAGQRLLPQVLSGLDDRYYLLNNLKLPGRADDVDHMIVGPNGIFALEVKHHRGRIFWRDGAWYQAKVSRRGHLQPEASFRDPTQQLKRNVDYLRTCINYTDRNLSRRTGLWIEGVVVFTHPAVTLDLPEGVVDTLPFPVLRARDLPAHISGHVPRRPYSKTEVRQIVALLGHLDSPYGHS